MIKFDVEMTDTFGDDANYSWVTRKVITVPENASDRSIVIAAKKALDITGVACKTQNMGDMIQLDIVGACVRVFITYREVYNAEN